MTNNVNYNLTYCLHRLPCGYCQIMNRPCPMYFGEYTPTWDIGRVTCADGTDGAGEIREEDR